MWIDAHLHLDAPEFDSDLEAVLGRAAAAGIRLMVMAGTSVERSRRALALAAQHQQLRVAVGIHPASADTADARALEDVAALAGDPRAIAIGEVGLDYARERVPRRVQVEVFRAQVRLARRVGLPLVVHTRDAFDDVERILNEEGSTGAIAHCFTGTPETAMRWAAAGWMLSFAGPLTFANADSLREAARCVPADRILVETDAPYLAPVPVRGRRCEPAFLIHTARVLADLRGVPIDSLEAAVEDNARRIFRLNESGRDRRLPKT
jgi:TatD DNase family protein